MIHQAISAYPGIPRLLWCRWMIFFPFDVNTDMARSVAIRMMTRLGIIDHEVTHITEMIDGRAGALLPP
ncbi:hypothetical protein GQ55_1G241500 [Panicum hallii var. hallii]|uniref:Uncharacterized protein n=1 Tax=Panicum hallii var. hallii TaxID=1504633 RepID=A0A2T7F6Z2_9POAL|nr:hypothetical protein GQ55_1G241500 [Panicum hallii var. hallii]